MASATVDEVNRIVSNARPGWSDSARRLLLEAAVRLDALRIAPRAALLAGWWRLLGKRLRARSVIAPLLGRSALAYRLWLAQGGDREVQPVPAPAHRDVAILALVVAGEGQDRTLASLAAEGIDSALVPAGQAPDASVAERALERGGWLLPMAAGDRLAAGAGASYRAAAARAGPDDRAIYADDDILDARGRRAEPHFKPDWNAELYRWLDYASGAAILRADRREVANLPADDWAAALTRRVIARAPAAPIHLRRVLHHRRARPAPAEPPPAQVGTAELPPVTVIVPTRNRCDLLRTCLEGVARTAYPGRVETIVIDNDSDDPATLEYLAALDPVCVRVLRQPGRFNFAAMNNRAVDAASGELLCFLNNDIEIAEPDWLAAMAVQAMRPDVGAVGARLLYPDGRIQHAGVVLGIGGGAAHAHRLLLPGEPGYFRRHALPQFVSAVTAACLVVRRDRFLAVDGFDAENFAVAFNDVDLCLKLNRRGWQSLYEPRATLVHHESVSRGLDRDRAGATRLAGELAALKRRWGTGGTAVDPFHHPSLSPFSERFVVRIQGCQLR
ncbi:glycosyltransferase family 2 protein [Pelagerythrobacter sp.]|uniref:glycosyltransferase family 2 protein n=1 Tax=Pelagerythrobacter sp. TaxID=2800702 RepID=UPI0035AFB921